MTAVPENGRCCIQNLKIPAVCLEKMMYSVCIHGQIISRTIHIILPGICGVNMLVVNVKAAFYILSTFNLDKQ